MEVMPDPSGVSEETSHPNFEPSGSVFTGFRRSSRESKFPSKFSTYIVEGKYKYGIERTINYLNLSSDNFCFIFNLNKIVEPCSFLEASTNPNWVTTRNNKMEALYHNNT